MTNKELILKTIRFEPTEHVPFAVLNGQMWVCARNNLTAAQLLDLPDAGAQLLVDAYKEIGTTISSPAGSSAPSPSRRSCLAWRISWWSCMAMRTAMWKRSLTSPTRSASPMRRI